MQLQEDVNTATYAVTRSKKSGNTVNDTAKKVGKDIKKILHL